MKTTLIIRYEFNKHRIESSGEDLGNDFTRKVAQFYRSKLRKFGRGINIRNKTR